MFNDRMEVYMKKYHSIKLYTRKITPGDIDVRLFLLIKSFGNKTVFYTSEGKRLEVFNTKLAIYIIKNYIAMLKKDGYKVFLR